MAAPETFLPPALSSSDITALIRTLSLPLPTTIAPLQVTAAFHSIYLITFPSSSVSSSAFEPAKALNPDGSITLVLRVSGSHVPRRKTLNEVATMRYIRENTNIPIPAVVRFDASIDNVIGHEFTLLEKAPGQSVDKMYGSLSEDIRVSLVRQLTDILLEMNRHEWTHVGGLSIDEDGKVVPGPVLEDTFWFDPDIERFWGKDETVDTLNPVGPFDTHSGLLQAYISCFIHAINTHPSLSWLQDLIPRLTALSDLTPALHSLQKTRLILAHKDLHFANIMALQDGTITAILDWEFAGVVPALRWDPVRAFLWSGVYSDEASAEKERMRAIWDEELQRRGVGKWWTDCGEDVEAVWDVIKFVRALVEVGPKGEGVGKVEGWRKLAEEALDNLRV